MLIGKIRQHWFTQWVVMVSIGLIFFSIPFIPVFLSENDSYGLPSERPAPEFTLFDVNGRSVSLTDFREKFVFLMFGYLHCDDICHSQALIFQEINHHADMKNSLHFLYVAMDPERDTPERLAAYFDGRGGNFTSLRDDSITRLQSLAAEYRAYFSREGYEQDDYEIRHTGFYFLIGPDGHLRHTYGPGQKQALLIVQDLLKLRDEYQTL